jgi:hypothetical protein
MPISNLKNNIKSWYEKFKTSGTSYKKSGMRPLKDWKIILISTQLIIIFLAVIAVYFYIQVDKGTFFAIPENGSKSELKINMSLFKKTVDDINSKSTLLNDIKAGKSIPADPSV